MQLIVTTVNGWKLLAIVRMSSVLDVAGVLDPSLSLHGW